MSAPRSLDDLILIPQRKSSDRNKCRKVENETSCRTAVNTKSINFVWTLIVIIFASEGNSRKMKKMQEQDAESGPSRALLSANMIPKSLYSGSYFLSTEFLEVLLREG